MNEIEFLKGILLGTGIALIVWFGVWRPTKSQIKPYWNIVKQKLKHPLTKIITYKDDEEIYWQMSMTDRIELKGYMQADGTHSKNKDWGIGNKPPNWWIGSSGSDNNSMLH